MTCIEGGPYADTLPLFKLAETIARRRLAGSALGALRQGEKVADLFCGAGGWGEGAKMLGIGVDYAVNHDAVAIAAHRANNPGCKHHQGDAWRTKPRDVIGMGTKLGLLMASAACTTHSRARGSAPISKRVHMLGWCITRWMKDAAPRVVLIENVPEWVDWGPTVVDADGVRRQDPARKGMHFRRWWRACQRLGYVIERRVLDAPDYGCASRRRRLFIIARRDGQPIVWPEVTHGHGGTEHEGAGGEDQVRGRKRRDGDRERDASTADGVPADPRRVSGGRPPSSGAGSRPTQPNRTAAECIDWSDLGKSIFERERPLRPKTLARIAEGIRRYVLNDPRPFVLRVTQSHAEGGGWHVRPVDRPMATQTTRQDIAVATPVVQVIRGDVMGRSVKDTLPTITAGNGPGRGAGAAHAIGIATPILATTGYGERDGQRARVAQVSDLLGTSVGGVKQAVVTPLLTPAGGCTFAQARPDQPYHAVLTREDTGLAMPILTHYRHGGGQTSRVDEPGHAVTAGGNHAMLVAALLCDYYGAARDAKRPDKPLGTVTTLDRHGLVCVMIDGAEYVIVDILFRMLRPAELARAMGFPEAYRWPKTQRDTVRLIGNAVAPPQARALVAAVFPGGRASRKAVRA